MSELQEQVNQIAEQNLTEQVAPSQGEPVQTQVEQPTEVTQTKEPEWKTRFQSPEQMYEYARQKQSEADSLKAKMDKMQREYVPPVNHQSTQPTPDELLEQFVKDPQNFMRNMVAPLQAQLAMNDFARTHPDFDGLRSEMADVVNRNPNILVDPEGLEMVYNHVKSKKESSMASTAATIKAQSNAQIEQIKRNSAFVEGSTQPAKSQPLKITKGMSTKEMDVILDQIGVPYKTET